MSSAIDSASFSALTNIPQAPVKDYTKWYAMTSVGASLAIALLVLGGTRYFGDALNPKRFALLASGTVISGATIFACRRGIHKSGNYKAKETEYLRKKSLYDGTKAILEKVMAGQTTLVEDERVCIKTLSLSDQQKLVAQNPKIIRIMVEDILDEDDQLYLKVKEIVNGLKNLHISKLKEIFSHLVELHETDSAKIKVFITKLIEDWRTKNCHTNRFMWSLSLAQALGEYDECHKDITLLRFLSKLFCGGQLLSDEECSNLIQTLDKKMPKVFQQFRLFAKTDDGKTVSMEHPTLLHMFIQQPIVINQVKVLYPELVSVQSLAVVVEANSDDEDEDERETISLSPLELYKFIHPNPTSQNPEVLRLLKVDAETRIV